MSRACVGGGGRCARRAASIGLAACALIAPAGPAAATGSAPEGIGERKGYKLEGQRLADRLELKVNVSTGNLVVKATDLRIAGTGLELRVERFYNSLSTRDDGTGPGWVVGVGHDVRLELSDGGAVLHGPSGYQVRFDRNADGTYGAPAPGIDATLTKRADGTFQLKWHSKDRYVFDAAGRWIEHRDKNGNALRFAYATSTPSRLTQVTDTRGRTVELSYTGGRLTSVSDSAGGRTYEYGYDAAGRLASSAVTAYALGTDNVNLHARTLFGYDASDRLVRVTDPRGNATTFGYDGDTRKVQSITRVTDPADGTGPTTRFSYLSSLSKCSGEENAVRETKVDGPRGSVADVTTHCLDRHDRAVAVFDSKGHKRTTKYASNSNVAQLNESGVASGPALGFEWSSDGQLDSISLPTGGQASYEYEDQGNLHMPTSVRDFSAGAQAAAPTWSYDYDDNGNLIEAKNDAEGIAYRYCYRGNGTVDRIAPPALDGLPLDENTSGTSCAGHPQGNDTLLYYNAKGELTRVDPPGSRGTIAFTYDALSRVATRVDGRGAQMAFAYDALDRVTRIDYTKTSPPPNNELSVLVRPDTGDTTATWITYSYDANGNLTARSDANGNSGFQYDALNRMTKETPESPSAVTTYSYDPAGNPTVIEAADEPAPVRYAYDSRNLVSSIVDQEGRTTTFAHSDKGLPRTRTYPNGVVMESRYDGSSRLVCTYAYRGTPPATDPADQESCPSPSTALLTYHRYAYQALVGGSSTDTHRRETATERDGSVTKYGYDAVMRLTKASTRDASGTLTREHAYSYSADGGLTREQVSGRDVANETRSQAYDLDGALCWSAAGAHAADCATPPLGATTYSYVGDGSLGETSAGLATTYSLRGHMIEITPPGGAAVAMKYTDATQDRRIDAGELRISYNQLGLSSQAPTNAASNGTWFVRDPRGTLVAMLSARSDVADLYYLFDGLGSVVATTDAGGNVVERYAYEPYGEEIGPSSTDRNPWRFASGYFDASTGMLKFGTRYYVPALGRWTQRDPVVGPLNSPAHLNPYAYVGGDPVNAIDPSGRFSFDFDNFDLSETLSAAFEGAVTGALIGGVTAGPVGALNGALSGAVSGAATSTLKQVGDEDVDRLVAAYEVYSQLKTLRTLYRWSASF